MKAKIGKLDLDSYKFINQLAEALKMDTTSKTDDEVEIDILGNKIKFDENLLQQCSDMYVKKIMFLLLNRINLLICDDQSNLTPTQLSRLFGMMAEYDLVSKWNYILLSKMSRGKLKKGELNVPLIRENLPKGDMSAAVIDAATKAERVMSEGKSPIDLLEEEYDKK